MPGQRNPADIAAEKYQPFDHQAIVVQPFETEGARDVEFRQSTRRPPSTCRYSLTGPAALEINKDLLDLIVEFNAWASVKPTHEHQKTSELLEKEVNFIIEEEKTQGRYSRPQRSCFGTRYIVQTASPRLLVPFYAY